MSMELDHSFTVPVPPDRAWDVLLDVERVAPCMPGATVEEFDGDVVTGRIKIKVGPVSLTYRGTARFTERDPDARVVVMDAAGKETRGAGTASATVRASLESAGDGTQILLHTTMDVTGRPAQFGRGVIAEVGGKLVEQFAENLAQLISDGGQPAAVEADSDDDAAAYAAEVDGGDSAADAGDDDVTMIDLPAVYAGEVDEFDVDVTVIDLPAVHDPAVAATDADSTEPAAEADSTEPAAEADSTEPATVAEPTASPAPAPTPAPAPASASAPAPAYREDSVILARLASPVILKRVLPVAVAVAIMALLGRRFLRRGKNR
jgi:carbon monoxide dehydrogenase subunit G